PWSGQRAREAEDTVLARELVLDAPPHLAAVLRPALRHGHGIDYIEHALQRTVERAALLASLEVLFGGEGFPLLPVIMQYQLFFAEMAHLAVLTKGSSARRSFCTARNTLCLAAPG